MTLFTSPGAIPRGSKLSAVWTRDDEDVCTVGMHIVHRAGDTELVDFTNADKILAEGAFSTLWGSLKTWYDEAIQLARYEWHEFGVGVRKPNPHSRETLLTPVPGTNPVADRLPPQVACSVTMKTTRRREWGRNYMPAPIKDACTDGLIDGDFVTALRDAYGTLGDALIDGDLALVVWAPRRDGVALQYGTAEHAADLDNPDTSSFALTVDQIQVDDLFDVIRSRRFDRATTKATHTFV